MLTRYQLVEELLHCFQLFVVKYLRDEFFAFGRKFVKNTCFALYITLNLLTDTSGKKNIWS